MWQRSNWGENKLWQYSCNNCIKNYMDMYVTLRDFKPLDLTPQTKYPHNIDY
jgi:hypothetical protein